MSPWSLSGRRRRGPRRLRIGGTDATSGFCARLSWVVLAAEMATATGRPDRSVTRWIFDPFLPRSVGFGPVSSAL